MPRKPRFFLPNIPVHVVIRGNNRQTVFTEDSDRKAYLDWLKEATEKEEVNVHAYVLMDNHVHLLLSANDPSHISRVMQHIGRKYVPYFNHKYGKSGTLWEGRFKSSMIESEQYLLCCYRYIELNPVRANMVTKPEDWKWSSYAYNAYGEKDKLIKPHAVYLAIDSDKNKRIDYYRDSFKQFLHPSLINDLRAAVQTGTPLGDDGFKKHIEQLLGMTVGYAKRGRPKNCPEKGTDPLLVYRMIQSLKKLKGVELVDSSLSMEEQATQVIHAPYVLIAHNATADPVFQYSNKKGLELFEMSWDEFTQLKSKYSAEPQNRQEREQLLNEVIAKGYADNYSGIRISKTGRRFQIKAATVWNIIDENNRKIGQAAMFRDYTYL